jgi:hypothetical protein
MNKIEFSKAVKIAQSDVSLSDVDDRHHYGYGLEGFEPVATSIEAVAKTLRWNCSRFNGNWDWEETTEMFDYKRKFIILG